MHKLSFLLTEDAFEYLDGEAAKHDVSRAEYVRWLLAPETGQHPPVPHDHAAQLQARIEQLEAELEAVREERDRLQARYIDARRGSLPGGLRLVARLRGAVFG